MGVKEDAQELSVEQQISNARRGLISLRDRLRNVGQMVGLSKPPVTKKSIETFGGDVIEGETVVDASATEASPAVPPEAIEAAPPEDLVEVRVRKYAYISDGTPGGYNPTAVTWKTRDGYTVSFRPRRPEDGDAMVVIEEDPAPVAVVEKDDGESYDQWRQRLYSGGGTGQQAPDAIKAGPGAGRHVPSRQSTWIERQSRFGGWGGR